MLIFACGVDWPFLTPLRAQGRGNLEGATLLWRLKYLKIHHKSLQAGKLNITNDPSFICSPKYSKGKFQNFQENFKKIFPENF